MDLAIIDYIVIVILIIFFIKGYKSGLIGMIGWLVGLLVGIWIAGKYYTQAAEFLGQWVDSQVLASVIGFVGLLVLIIVILGIIFTVINRIFNFIPVLGFFNKLIGGVLGIIEAIIILGILFWLIGAIPVSNGFTNSVNNAQLRGPIISATTMIRNLLPESLKALTEFGQKINNNVDLQNFNPETFDITDIDMTNFDPDQIPDAVIKDLQKKYSPEEIESFLNQLSPTQAAELRDKLH